MVKEGDKLRKKITVFLIFLACICILIGNIPSGMSNTPTTNLDPAEGSVSTTVWTFYYGHSSTYGSYIRDVRWAASGTKDRYIGMANMPYIFIDGSSQDLTVTPTTGPSLTTIGTNQYLVSTSFSISAPGVTHTVTVNYELVHRSANSDAYIDIYIELTSSDNNEHTIGMASRVDYDIDGLVTAGNDEAYLYKNTQNPQWQQETSELTFTDGNPRDTTRNLNGGLKVKQIDATTSGPWGAIEPRSQDIIIIVKFNSNEYTSYNENQENINPADIVIWTETNEDNYDTWDPNFPTVPATVRNIAWIL